MTEGSAVLVRAIRPVTGLDAMRPDIKLCAGPRRVCAALGIDAHWDSHDLMQPPFVFRAEPGDGDIQEGPRIGISLAIAFRRKTLALFQQADGKECFKLMKIHRMIAADLRPAATYRQWGQVQALQIFSIDA